MTEQDRHAFAEAMFAVSETFNEPLSDVKIEAYFDALKEFDVAPVLAALKGSISSSEFFPRPIKLRELIEGDAAGAADAAWGAVLREIRRVGYVGTPNLEPRALRAVRELWGSWGRLCETLPGEGPELVGWVKQFKQVYGSVEKSEQRALTMGDLHPNVRQFIQAGQRKLR